MILQFSYEKLNDIKDEKIFLSEEGNFSFDKNSEKQMLIMMNLIIEQLNLIDEYSIKKLETMLKYELPTFTITRKLVKNWVVENFVY